MSSHEPRHDPANHARCRTSHLCLAALACALCATAMAQQTPLTGRMLGNQPQATGTTPPPPGTQPATTYPAHPMHGEQQAPSPSLPPAHASMPAYTDMQTLGPQSNVTEAEADAKADALADMPLPRDAVFGTPIGGTTEYLLHMQGHNRSAGPARPMLGDEAAAAYKRYIDSFKHPIPEFFQTKVSSGSQSGSGRQ